MRKKLHPEFHVYCDACHEFKGLASKDINFICKNCEDIIVVNGKRVKITDLKKSPEFQKGYQMALDDIAAGKIK